jgi:hypothetical protein
MEGVKTWLSSQAAYFFDTGIQNLVLDKTNALPLDSPEEFNLWNNIMD